MTNKAVRKLYARRDVAIDGKHFKAGAEVKGVDSEQLDLSERQGFVGPDKPGAAPAAEAGEKN